MLTATFLEAAVRLKAFTGAAAQMADIVKKGVYADQAKTAGRRAEGRV